MEIFAYAPEWKRIEKRKSMFIEKTPKEGSLLLLDTPVFYMKKGGPKKKKEEVCGICRKEMHIGRPCGEKEKTAGPGAGPEEDDVYRVECVLTPCTVKVMNVPAKTERHQIKEILQAHGVKYDMILMVTTKGEKVKEFKGVVYIELPTKEEGAKCVAALDGTRMDVQVLSAMVVERKTHIE